MKIPADSYDPDFSRLSDQEQSKNSARRNLEENKASPLLGDVAGVNYIDQFGKSLQKQDAQKLQNQLDVIEEEVEENQDTKFQGFNAVKQKMDNKGPIAKDNATIISGLVGNVTART